MTRPYRPSAFVGCHVLLGPRTDTGVAPAGRRRNARGRIDPDELHLKCPAKQRAHRVQKVLRLPRCMCSALKAGADSLWRYGRERTRRRRFESLPINPVPFGPRCLRAGLPRRRGAEARYQPSQRPGRCTDFCGRLVGCNRRLILRIELRRAELGLDTHALAGAPHVPNRLAVTCSLMTEKGRRGRGMVVITRTISSSGSSGFSMAVDCPSLTITDCSPIFTTTSDAPACFAARIMRATSAWVI